MRLAGWLLLFSLGACTELRHKLVDDPVRAGEGGNGPRDAAVEARDTGAADARPAADAAPPQAGATAATRCGKQACACDNGVDDDQDGVVDGLDPECTAGFDNDEETFATGQSTKSGACRDCFWDDNAGFGDDGCRYPAECLTGADPNGNGNCSSCQVSTQCVDSCLRRTPNGCDCFGCCEVVRSNGDHTFIELTETCKLDKLDEPASCPRCVQNSFCKNPCGRCELCLGRNADSLPADCRRGPDQPAYQCEDGLSTCATTQDCSLSEYCQLGCCLVDLL